MCSIFLKTYLEDVNLFLHKFSTCTYVKKSFILDMHYQFLYNACSLLYGILPKDLFLLDKRLRINTSNSLEIIYTSCFRIRNKQKTKKQNLQI